MTEAERRRAWLAGLPQLRDECAEQWSLQLGKPFIEASASLALPAKLEDGSDAVLKIGFPHRESEHEADALARWAGDGAVRLVARDDRLGALLIERCRPGTPLNELGPDEALEVLIALLPRLWVPAGEPFRTLHEEVRWWLSDLAARWERTGQPFERDLLDAAVEALVQLSATQGEQVLVHQDLHAGNVLRAEREPWLVVDPKPLSGEREFGLAPIIRGGELGHSEAAVGRRLDSLSAELGLDRERARGWALGQTIAWAWEDEEVLPDHVETARWLLAAA